MRERIADGTKWGWNTDERGTCWIDAEDTIDVAAIVGALVTDPSTVEVVPREQLVRRARTWPGSERGARRT
jgi:hypothetical protein